MKFHLKFLDRGGVGTFNKLHEHIAPMGESFVFEMGAKKPYSNETQSLIENDENVGNVNSFMQNNAYIGHNI